MLNVGRNKHGERNKALSTIEMRGSEAWQDHLGDSVLPGFIPRTEFESFGIRKSGEECD